MKSPNVFSSRGFDRAHLLRRDNQALMQARQHPEARVALVWRSKSLVRATEQPEAALLPIQMLESLIEESEHTTPLVFLGLSSGAPLFTLDISSKDDPTQIPEVSDAGGFVDLRRIGAVLEPEQAALLAYARGINTWHVKHRFCGECGALTESRDAGHQRVCTVPDCGRESFPRTDPAVIMLVHSRVLHSVQHSEVLPSGASASPDCCLLGRQEAWPHGMFSTLAGFVEPGESLESAVAREVFEETSVRVIEANYHSSQPWPFPSSIMLGFLATAEPGPVEVDGDELDQARWFEKQELEELLTRREVRLPPPMSIARRLIDDWLGR